MRWASLAIFFPALGLGDYLHWRRLEPALGGCRRRGFLAWSDQPKGLVHWRQSILISRLTLAPYGQTHAQCTRSAPQPPQPPQGALSAQGDPVLCVAFSCLSLAVDMASHVERDGTRRLARRRRERRLRSWWRHERQSAPHGADRCHTTQCREGGGRRVELRPTGTDDGQRRVADGCLEGAGVAGWGARGAAMPGLRCAVARPRRSGRRRRWCGRLLPRLPCPSRL